MVTLPNGYIVVTRTGVDGAGIAWQQDETIDLSEFLSGAEDEAADWAAAKDGLDVSSQTKAQNVAAKITARILGI